MLKIVFKHPFWIVCAVSIIFVSIYWSFVASNRYISYANIVLESPRLEAPSLNIGSLLSGSNSNNSDMLILREYLLSFDMLTILESELKITSHYANTKVDFFTRLRSENISKEELHNYYLSQISVELDNYANVLRIKTAAFNPLMAKKITEILLAEGEKKMNQLGQRIAEEQVHFLEKQVLKLSLAFSEARQHLLDYQNQNGLISPLNSLNSLSAVVANLESQLANLNAKYTALTSYQSPKSPAVLKIKGEIQALSKQIGDERARMAKKGGNALNVLSAKYQSKELKVQFSQEAYSGALAALESIRIESARKLKQISVIQNPTLPEYATEPRRLYNSIVFSITAVFLTLILQMLLLIVKDHRD